MGNSSSIVPPHQEKINGILYEKDVLKGRKSDWPTDQNVLRTPRGRGDDDDEDEDEEEVVVEVEHSSRSRSRSQNRNDNNTNIIRRQHFDLRSHLQRRNNNTNNSVSDSPYIDATKPKSPGAPSIVPLSRKTRTSSVSPSANNEAEKRKPQNLARSRSPGTRHVFPGKAVPKPPAASARTQTPPPLPPAAPPALLSLSSTSSNLVSRKNVSEGKGDASNSAPQIVVSAPTEPPKPSVIKSPPRNSSKEYQQAQQIAIAGAYISKIEDDVDSGKMAADSTPQPRLNRNHNLDGKTEQQQQSNKVGNPQATNSASTLPPSKKHKDSVSLEEGILFNRYATPEEQHHQIQAYKKEIEMLQKLQQMQRHPPSPTSKTNFVGSYAYPDDDNDSSLTPKKDQRNQPHLLQAFAEPYFGTPDDRHQKPPTSSLVEKVVAATTPRASNDDDAIFEIDIVDASDRETEEETKEKTPTKPNTFNTKDEDGKQQVDAMINSVTSEDFVKPLKRQNTSPPSSKTKISSPTPNKNNSSNNISPPRPRNCDLVDKPQDAFLFGKKPPIPKKNNHNNNIVVHDDPKISKELPLSVSTSSTILARASSSNKTKLLPEKEALRHESDDDTTNLPSVMVSPVPKATNCDDENNNKNNVSLQTLAPPEPEVKLLRFEGNDDDNNEKVSVLASVKGIRNDKAESAPSSSVAWTVPPAQPLRPRYVPHELRNTANNLLPSKDPIQRGIAFTDHHFEQLRHQEEMKEFQREQEEKDRQRRLKLKQQQQQQQKQVFVDPVAVHKEAAWQCYFADLEEEIADHQAVQDSDDLDFVVKELHPVRGFGGLVSEEKKKRHQALEYQEKLMETKMAAQKQQQQQQQPSSRPSYRNSNNKQSSSFQVTHWELPYLPQQQQEHKNSEMENELDAALGLTPNRLMKNPLRVRPSQHESSTATTSASTATATATTTRTPGVIQFGLGSTNNNNNNNNNNNSSRSSSGLYWPTGTF